MVLSTIRVRPIDIPSTVEYALRPKVLLRCCWWKEGEKDVALNFFYREEISQDATNDQTSLMIRIEKYGYIRPRTAKRANRGIVELSQKASNDSLK